MSYFVGLDEYTTTALRDEMDRRETLRDAGLCDYCERPSAEAPCRFPDRHAAGVLTPSR